MATLFVVTIFVWAGALLLKWKLPFLIGRSGENFVSRKLAELDPHKYKVIDDLMLPSSGNTDTTQIDHVVVSNFGIFCIETKTYSGWIFGDARQERWTQGIYRYKKKFYNPLRQNYAHIKALEAVVKPAFTQAPIRGFVAFPSAERLQISGTDTVGHVRDVIEKMKAFSVPVLSDAERDRIVELLENANIKDKEARKLHNRQAYALKTADGF